MCRLYHGKAPSPPGAPNQLLNLYHAVLTFNVGLNVTTMTKKVVNFLGEEKCTPDKKSARPEKILATRMRKGPPPYVGTLVCPPSNG